MAVQEPPEQRVGWNVALDVLIQQRQIHRAQASPCLPSRLRLPPVTVDAAQNRTMGADGHRRAIPSGLCRYLDAVNSPSVGGARAACSDLPLVRRPGLGLNEIIHCSLQDNERLCVGA